MKNPNDKQTNLGKPRSFVGLLFRSALLEPDLVVDSLVV